MSSRPGPLPLVQPRRRSTSTADTPSSFSRSGDSSRLLPKDIASRYAIYIDEHSKRLKRDFLASGENFSHLARFLQQRISRDNEAGTAATHPPMSFLVVLTLSGGDPHNIHPVCLDSTALQNPGFSLPRPEARKGQLVFMRGFASPQWLKEVGSSYRVDPEFFRRHLDFLQTKNYYDLPALPSTSRNTVSIRVTDIFVRSVPLTNQQIRESRRDELPSIGRYQRRLGSGGLVGESILRRLAIIDQDLFAVEHNISVCIKSSREHGWTALVWVDVGRHLSQCPYGPWNGPASSGDQHAVCNPIIQHRPNLALSSQANQSTNASETNPSTNYEDLSQSVSHLPTQYGSTLNGKIMAEDAMYALTELFTFAAASESQFLNAMEQTIKGEMGALPTARELSVANLTHLANLLKEHIQHLNGTIRLLQTRGDPRWPRTQTHADVVEETNALLLSDFQFLRDRAAALAQQCTSGVDTMVSETQLDEARKGLLQAERATKLTLLAFLYLPLSLTTSIFGMNVVGISDTTTQFWAPIVVCAVVMIITAVIYFWGDLTRGLPFYWAVSREMDATTPLPNKINNQVAVRY